VDDRKIRALNRRYLRHDYATDVITFDWSEGKGLWLEGEILISAQTAKRNAAQYTTNVKDEILLYMVHGVLHLLGYDDHSPSDVKKMRAKEDVLMRLLRRPVASSR